MSCDAGWYTVFYYRADGARVAVPIVATSGVDAYGEILRSYDATHGKGAFESLDMKGVVAGVELGERQ
jgi:hypothetical protein